MTKKVKQTAAVASVDTFDLSKYKSKSDAIRSLAAEGKSRSEIAKLMNIRYQFVRNVLTAPLKKQ